MEQLYWVEGREQKLISAIVHTPDSQQLEKFPVIVYCHGFTGNKTGDNRMGVKLARDLCSYGYMVVRFDHIGSGESEGEFETDTSISGWLADTESILSWVKGLKQANKQRLGMIGHSLGGAIVTYFTSRNHQIKTACALAPVTRLEDNFRSIIIGPELWEQAVQGKTIHHFYNKRYSLSPLFVKDLQEYNILSCAKKITQPFLVIHGEKDQAVPLNHSIELMDLINSPIKELQIFENEAHLFSTEIHSTIRRWFDKSL